LKGIFLANHSFQGGERLICSKQAYLAKMNNHMYFQRKPSKLEAAASGT
jgi:hypothetical protein